jgi:hypothetical protein
MLNGGQQNNQPDNPYLGATSSYGGNSPQFEAMLGASNKDITDNFMRGTAAAQIVCGGSLARLRWIGRYRDAGRARQATERLHRAEHEPPAQCAVRTFGGQLEQQDYSVTPACTEQHPERVQRLRERCGSGFAGHPAQQAMGNTDLQRWMAVMGAGDLQRRSKPRTSVPRATCSTRTYSFRCKRWTSTARSWVLRRVRAARLRHRSSAAGKVA